MRSRQLGSWGAGELGNWGTGELGNWGTERQRSEASQSSPAPGKRTEWRESEWREPVGVQGSPRRQRSERTGASGEERAEWSEPVGVQGSPTI